MGKFDDKSGRTYGDLTVISFVCFDRFRHSLWKCLCRCGSYTVVASVNLVTGAIKSCGCGEDEYRMAFGASKITHGHTRNGRATPEYGSWLSMISRCTNPKRKSWKDYGERGITICQQWIESFENFLKDMGPRPKGTSLERIDNNGNYEPENCKWATYKEQANNTRRNINLTLNGTTGTVSQWSERLGCNESQIRQRIKNGWSEEKTLTYYLEKSSIRTNPYLPEGESSFQQGPIN